MGTVKVKLPKSVIVFLAIIGVVIGGFIVWGQLRKANYDKVINSEEEIYSIIERNVCEYKNNISFYTDIDPSTFDYDRIFSDIVERDTYIGSQVYSFSYQYKITSRGYKVNIKLRDPLPHRTLLTKWRVKQIASKVKGMDDYDAIKAVHDYLILSNEYTITMSSAFNTLYVGKSCCNGYAYAFYAIMKEAGIPVTCEFGGAHAWNKVMLDGEWYNIDLTWDDIGGRDVSYDYFLKCDADWEGHEHGGATATQSIAPKGRSAMENYRLFPNYRLITVIIAVIIGAIICFIIFKAYKKRRINELIKLHDEVNAKPQVRVIENDDIEFDSPELKRVELLNDSVKTKGDTQGGSVQITNPTWANPENNPNMTFGQAPSPKPVVTEPVVQSVPVPQPLNYGQAPVAPQPLNYGQAPVAPQPLTYGQVPTPQPLTYGQVSTPQPLVYGQVGAPSPEQNNKE